MNPLLLAGGVAGAIALVDYSGWGAGVQRAVAAGCTAQADAKAKPQDTIEQVNAILADLVTKADAGRTSGLYSEAIDTDLDAAKAQLAGSSGGFFSPNLDDSRDAVAQLAMAMDGDCSINKVAGGFFTSAPSTASQVAHGIWTVGKESVLLPWRATQLGVSAAWDAAKGAVHEFLPDWLIPLVLIGGVLLVGGVVYFGIVKGHLL